MVTPMICHVTTPPLWLQALHRGTLWAPSLTTEGFIHCSRLDQIEAVVNRFYADTATLTVVLLDESAMEAEVVWEGAAHPDGSLATDNELFPHVYGVISMSAVRASRAWRRNLNGQWVLPDDLIAD
jgi:uncharacterized protein (DUF952 family)